MNPFANLFYHRPFTGERQSRTVRADLCVYGGTSAGVAAAVQAAKSGLRAVIANPGTHLGGMTSGGLGATDIGNKAAIGGLSRQFYQHMLEYYAGRNQAQWTFEPHVAESLFTQWTETWKVRVFPESFLSKAETSGGKITRLVMENGLRFEAPVFIDATYEGDLMASAGVSYRVGREANSLYRETLDGVYFGHPDHSFETWVDPFRVEGKPDSGLVWGVSEEEPGFQGQGDGRVQAYNFRICLSKDPDRLPFPEPPAYDPGKYELLARYIRSGVWDAMGLNTPLPNGKTDLNNHGAVSTDMIGFSRGWPDGDYETRERIFQEHFNYDLGMLYFLANDLRVPEEIRAQAGGWGLPRDEFTRTGGWPHQLYIREARRMVSDYVVTESDCRHLRAAKDPVALAAYTMDSHHCRRVVLDGRCVNEGNVEVRPTSPYGISYRSIVPARGECGNLLVPVCLSASHIAYGSIRMEPVFMVLGQSAATAAALALEGGCAVQDVDYGLLRKKLLADGQILEW